MKRCLALALLAASPGALAQDMQWHGYLDARAVAACPAGSAGSEGGLGKARFGGPACGPQAAAVLAGAWQIAPAWSAAAELELDPQRQPSLGLLEAYLRYRPVSTTPWRWSVRAGAFFPPVSMENDAIGWTSPWTLTPSAINTWIGEEFRTLGVEARFEHRSDRGSLEAGAAVFWGNDPAGELLASRGWALHDLVSPLGARLREPDAYAPFANSAPPVRYQPFVENDHRPGWHADLGWRSPRGLHLRLARYDNLADPSSSSIRQGHEVFSWRTAFWSAGAEWPVGAVSVLAQWMAGDTTVEPAPDLYLDSRFRSAYLLVGRNRGAWRPALRFDHFDIRPQPSGGEPPDEVGHSWTAALAWRPLDSLRVSAEWLRISSQRGQREFAGLPAKQVDQQFQLSLRFLF